MPMEKETQEKPQQQQQQQQQQQSQVDQRRFSNSERPPLSSDSCASSTRLMLGDPSGCPTSISVAQDTPSCVANFPPSNVQHHLHHHHPCPSSSMASPSKGSPSSSISPSSSSSSLSKHSLKLAPNPPFRKPIGRSYMGISEEMMDEMYQYRYSFLLLTLALIYAIIALGAAILNAPPGSSSSSDQQLSSSSTFEWNQEMIAGWYRDRPMPTPQPDYVGPQIRECKSRIELHQVSKPISTPTASSTTTTSAKPEQVSVTGSVTESEDSDASQAQARNLTSTTAIPASPTTTTPPSAKWRRKFEALNGCLFRRDSSSDFLGDICCCAGVPRRAPQTFKELLVTPTSSKPANLTIRTGNSTAGMEEAGKTGTNQASRTYLKPQLICFVSSAASLFNRHRLLAPLVNEQNLAKAFLVRERQQSTVSAGSRCITCSCCHEHEPEMVNKLLADVPIYADQTGRRLSRMIDRNGNQLRAPASPGFNDLDSYQGDDDTGLWVSIRERLVNSFKSLHELYFGIYETLESSLMWARYGDYPVRLNDTNGFILYVASSLMRPHSFELKRADVTSSPDSRSTTEPPSLFIDDDSYDDFTTTTTTTTTTTSTTTAEPSTTTSTKAPTTRSTTRRRRKRRRRTRTTTKKPSSGSSSTTTASTDIPDVSADEPSTSSSPVSTSPSPKLERDLKSSTSKAPTVIINVYAGEQSSQVTSSTTSVRPSSPPTESSKLEVKIHLPVVSAVDAPLKQEIKLLQKNSIHEGGNKSELLEEKALLASSAKPANLRLSNNDEGDTFHKLQSGESSSSTTSRPPGSEKHSNETKNAAQAPPSSIVISLGSGNSTTIIATINATRFTSEANPEKVASARSTGKPALTPVVVLPTTTIPSIPAAIHVNISLNGASSSLTNSSTVVNQVKLLEKTIDDPFNGANLSTQIAAIATTALPSATLQIIPVLPVF